MSSSLLHQLAHAALPFTVTGPAVAAVQSWVDGGLVTATIAADPTGRGQCSATVHTITAIGHRHLRAFVGKARSASAGPPSCSGMVVTKAAVTKPVTTETRISGWRLAGSLLSRVKRRRTR